MARPRQPTIKTSFKNTVDLQGNRPHDPRDQFLEALDLVGARLRAARKELENGERLFDAAMDYVRRNGRATCQDPLNPALEQVKGRVAQALHIGPAEISRGGRKVPRSVSRARHMVIWLCRELELASIASLSRTLQLSPTAISMALAAQHQRRQHDRNFRALGDQLLAELRLRQGRQGEAG